MLYLVKMNINEDVQYTTLKPEITNFKNTLCHSISAAKRLYYMRILPFVKMTLNKLGL